MPAAWPLHYPPAVPFNAVRSDSVPSERLDTGAGKVRHGRGRFGMPASASRIDHVEALGRVAEGGLPHREATAARAKTFSAATARSHRRRVCAYLGRTGSAPS